MAAPGWRGRDAGAQSQEDVAAVGARACARDPADRHGRGTLSGLAIEHALVSMNGDAAGCFGASVSINDLSRGTHMAQCTGKTLGPDAGPEISAPPFRTAQILKI